jgi:hypothetical protein
MLGNSMDRTDRKLECSSARKRDYCMAIRGSPDSTIPETIRWQLSIDSLERSAQHTSGTNLFKPVDAILEHLTHGIFPPHRAHHLAAKQVSNFAG